MLPLVRKISLLKAVNGNSRQRHKIRAATLEPTNTAKSCTNCIETLGKKTFYQLFRKYLPQVVQTCQSNN